MTNLIIFILASYGISNILVYGSVFEWLRNLIGKMGTGPVSLHKLFTCMMCMPTWVGFILSFVLQSNGVETPFVSYGLDNLWLVIFFDGVLASGSVYTLNVIVEYFED